LIVPPAVSLGEASGASLDTALRAIIAGYSAMTWLGADGEVGWALVSRGFRRADAAERRAAAEPTRHERAGPIRRVELAAAQRDRGVAWGARRADVARRTRRKPG